MATLYQRLMHDAEPTIPNHAFFATLKEYARRKIDDIAFIQTWDISGADSLLYQILSYVDNGFSDTIDDALARAQEVEDVFLIHEHNVSKALYPTQESIIIRLNMS